MSSLLDPEFLRRLARVRLLVRRRFAGSAGGARRSTRKGQSVEMADHRPYSPGDDVRRIDWNAYARLEELILRLYVAEEDLVVYLLLDTSASMGFGAPSKLQQSARLAAGFAAVALGGEDRVAALATSESARLVGRPGSGRRGLLSLCASLDGLRAERGTSLASAASVATSALGGRGLCVIVSDLLDPDGALAGARACRLRGHEVVLVEVLTPFEIDPPDLSGLELEDAETGAIVELPPEGALAAYRESLATHRAELDAEAAELGIGVLRVSTEDAFDEVLIRALESGVLRHAA